jgi:hypothetical protein
LGTSGRLKAANSVNSSSAQIRLVDKYRASSIMDSFCYVRSLRRYDTVMMGTAQEIGLSIFS